MTNMDSSLALLTEAIGYLSLKDQEKVLQAYTFAHAAHIHMVRKSGEPYIIHPIKVAHILAELKMDTDTLVAGLLHDTVEDTDVTLEQIEQAFGVDVKCIVEGETKVSKLAKFSERAGLTKQDEQAENLRQMLIAMTGDIRIIIVKLADRLHNMRTLEFMPPQKQKRIAQETLEIFAPLAHRLGIGQIKWELEDLSFKYLYPDDHAQLIADLETSQLRAAEAVKEAATELQIYFEKDTELTRLVERFEVMGRSKHLWSIYQKMLRDQRSIEQIFDLLAIRIIFHPKPVSEDEIQLPQNVDEKPADHQARLAKALDNLALIREKQLCYQILGIVHTLWTPIPGRFKDYIAVPKPNGYQSLHTTVINRSGQPIEVQMRSGRMHQIAEYGVAAHWLYKQGKKLESGGNKAEWIRQLEQLQSEIKDASDFIDAVKDDLLSGRVFVFTPKGKTINLPKDATPIDFAYHIHTGVGDTCSGARVNGMIVTLNYKLQNGDLVEIITQKNAHPSRDWMGIAITRSARAKIRHYFRTQERQEAILDGHNTLERYLRKRQFPVRQLMRTKNLEEITEKLLGSHNPDDLYLQIHSGRITPAMIAKLVAPPSPDTQAPPRNLKPSDKARPQNAIYVDGQLLGGIKMANCCHPIQGDSIVAYTTRGRGMTVHRNDCPSLQRLRHNDPSRIHTASWEESSGEYPIDLKILAHDRTSLMGDISVLMGSLQKNMLRLSAVSVRGSAQVRLRIFVRDQDELVFIASALKRIPDIQEIWRMKGGKEFQRIEANGSA